MRSDRIFVGIAVAALALVLLVGIASCAYNIGVSQGTMVVGAVAPSVVQPNTVPAPVAPSYAPSYAPWGGYAPMAVHRPFGFGFGFLWCLFPILFFILIAGFFKFMFGRRRWGGGPPWMNGPGGWDPTTGDIPTQVREMHRKLHEEDAASTPPPTPPPSTPPASEPAR